MSIKKIAAAAALCAVSGSLLAANITGAGASFPQPVYAQWAQAYQKATGNQVNYQSIGSSGGVKQITAKTVDFGATDAPLTQDQLQKEGLIQFPTVVGGVVPIVNIDGVAAGKMKLNGTVLADIYLGKITQWDDASIAALNPGLKLPSAKIVTVYRADGSGTTFNFTHYLSQVSAEWKNKAGVANTVKWPTANSGVAGKGNEGVASYVRRVNNSIGYVEYAYAKQNSLAYTQLQNKAGKFIQPSQASFAAAADTDWKNASGYHLILTNQGGANAWPIAAATFILVHKNPADSTRSQEVLKFFEWAFTQGDAAASKLDYVPLPAATKSLIRQTWREVK
ncbi:phosphate ABC transporter substrate-binding protein PstS [Stenoxybacter acetivorans]|uniref:phosphate ABC transporter substrate-binding protein PstS n=1 Tax=Stenoxybacter acetivorans TaxID=422441 RepID=UPI000568A2F5|nr:phosphate ABC transporter substrate-binding protein PstS [Stenoxybacter acetivorans]